MTSTSLHIIDEDDISEEDVHKTMHVPKFTNTKFAFSGNDVDLVQSPPEILDSLPAAFYALKFDPSRGLYLSRISPFDMPEKLYGDIGKRADRITTTFESRQSSTGLLLSGEKGSGKTLLGKKVAMDLLAKGMPVIVVNIPISGDMFGIFLQQIGKPVTLFFDEFEKVYKEDHGAQEGLLTILDGVYPVRFMAIMTTNDSSKVADPLINRPGRVFYKIDYAGLDFAFVRDYASEKLENKDHLDDLLRLAAITTLNFDQLQALIEEMNRYDETVREAIQFINVSIDRDSVSTKILSLTDSNGKNITKSELHTEYFYGDLTTTSEDEEEEEEEEDGALHFAYYRPNLEKWNWSQFHEHMSSDESNGITSNAYYTLRSIVGSYQIGESEREKVLAKIPVLVTIQRKHLKIEPRPNGELVVSDKNTGVKVVMRRTRTSFSKDW